MAINREDILFISLSHIRDIWDQSEDGFPHWLKRKALDERQDNEAFISGVQERIKSHTDSYPRYSKKKRKIWKDQGEQILDQVIEEENIIYFRKLCREDRESFFDMMKQFMRDTRSFDPDMPQEDMFQAFSNFCICAMFTAIINRNKYYTKALWGYSMLYPYTDNILDDLKLSPQEKADFNENFCRRLKGELVKGRNSGEERIFEIISNIESVFNRTDYEEVYDSLMLIYDAQVRSLKTQDQENDNSLEELLNISIEKGGTSVLADRCLITGSMENDSADFYMGFGFFLQLADDLQDVKEDSENCHRTLLTCIAETEVLDRTVNKMFSLLHTLFEDYSFSSQVVKEFVRNNCYLLLYVNISLSKEYFSSGYLEQIENYMPISINYLQNFNINGQPFKMQSLMKIIDEMIE